MATLVHGKSEGMTEREHTTRQVSALCRPRQSIYGLLQPLCVVLGKGRNATAIGDVYKRHPMDGGLDLVASMLKRFRWLR